MARSKCVTASACRPWRAATRPSPSSPTGGGGRLRRQRLIRSRARVEVTGVEQHLCHPRSCRQQRGRQPERLLKRHGRLGGPHQTLQHHAVQVPPVRTGRRQHLSPLIGEVCRFPLLPRLKGDSEPPAARRLAGSASLRRVRASSAVRASEGNVSSAMTGSAGSLGSISGCAIAGAAVSSAATRIVARVRTVFTVLR